MANIRTIEVISPLPGLRFERMTGSETLGRLFEFDVDLLGKDGNLKLSGVLGKPMTVMLSLGEPPLRYFNGLIARCSLLEWTGENFRYRVKLRPWLWLLSRSTNSRIFQAKTYATVTDVLKKIFDEYGGTFDVQGIHPQDYPCPEYLVQYQETDLAFVSRLMEQAGIYYFFRHDPGKDDQPGVHTLVLADGLAHAKVKRYEKIPYFPPNSNRAIDRVHEHIDTWSLGYQVEPGGYAAKEFDFEIPRAPLLSSSHGWKDHPHGDLEVFEYPGRYIDTKQRDAYVIRRRQEEQLGYEVIQGTGNARGITPGYLFALTDYPADDQNKEYLLTGATYTLETTDYASGAGAEHDEFRCSFTGVDAHVIYRTPVTTPKPTVAGPQTAIVVGPKGEEIWTDKYGRVKVQFHWDRLGKSDDKSSCWVRVSQIWAGAKWGAMHIPRIGQEVIVDFLEGDPDRPIITGRVYNGDNMPPYDLTAHQTQSGIKSRSTPNGSPSNFNEIRFEDKKGSEEMYLQAEKDQTTHVKHDRSANVDANDTVTVGGDRTMTVTGNLSVTVKGGGKSPVHSSLDVTGKHHLHASDCIDVDAPNYIKLVVGGSMIHIEPGKITLQAGGKAMIVLDAHVLAQSSDKSQVVLDANALTKSSGGSQVLLDANVLAKSSGGSTVILDSNAALAGTKATVTGKSEAVLSAGAGSVKTDAGGVEAAGPTVKMNS
jgi:type VI secretion system secreted protein VgrG